MATRKEWLLMALAHRAGQPMTPVQIQKAMFLMSVEAKQLVGQRFYTFVPYNYGPFDADVYHDLDDLVGQGVAMSNLSPGRSWRTFTATAAGIAAAAKLKQSEQAANPKAVEYLGRAVEWVCSLSFPALVRAIYSKYPQYKANSVFAG